MYQVVADLANRFCAQHTVHLLAAQSVPEDRFAPAVRIHRLARSGNSGLELTSLDPVTLARVLCTAARIAPDVVHFVAPHVWNLPLILWLRAKGIPVLYSLHDLDPHMGTAFGWLMRLFNAVIVRLVDRLFVYGKVYKERLIANGLHAAKIAVIPITHLFLSYSQEDSLRRQPPAPSYERSVLFFGRLEPYKGIDVLLQAFGRLVGSSVRLIVAGRGEISPYLPPGGLPPNVTVHNRYIDDSEAIELFRTCGLLALPYKDATQSALIPAAYFFHKPVVATRCGALPEYLLDGETGHLVEPDNIGQLAERIREALDDPCRLRAMGQAGYRWYVEKREIEHQILETEYSRAASLRYPSSCKGTSIQISSRQD
jgi:glycosyltransferase involved in cell wall biosynthesis